MRVRLPFLGESDRKPCKLWEREEELREDIERRERACPQREMLDAVQMAEESLHDFSVDG